MANYTETNAIPVYQAISRKLSAIAKCKAVVNSEYPYKQTVSLERLISLAIPSGSGLDSGPELSEDSTPEKLIFSADYHHMNDHGYYSGWTQHQVIVRPSLCWGISLSVTGRDRNEIKECIAELFQHALTRLVVETADGWEYAKEEVHQAAQQG